MLFLPMLVLTLVFSFSRPSVRFFVSLSLSLYFVSLSFCLSFGFYFVLSRFTLSFFLPSRSLFIRSLSPAGSRGEHTVTRSHQQTSCSSHWCVWVYVVVGGWVGGRERRRGGSHPCLQICRLPHRISHLCPPRRQNIHQQFLPWCCVLPPCPCTCSSSRPCCSLPSFLS
jgi:hypothetical protein